MRLFTAESIRQPMMQRFWPLRSYLLAIANPRMGEILGVVSINHRPKQLKMLNPYILARRVRWFAAQQRNQSGC